MCLSSDVPCSHILPRGLITVPLLIQMEELLFQFKLFKETLFKSSRSSHCTLLISSYSFLAFSTYCLKSIFCSPFHNLNIKAFFSFPPCSPCLSSLLCRALVKVYSALILCNTTQTLANAQVWLKKEVRG